MGKWTFSLVALAIISVTFRLAIGHRHVPVFQCVRKITMPVSYKEMHTKPWQFTVMGNLRRHPRHFLDINLTGNADTDRVLMAYSTIRIREIFKKGDTVNGVKIIWNDNFTYGDFLKILDITDSARAKAWMVYEDTLWVVNLSSSAENQ